MHIKPTDRDLKQLLETGFFRIPPFQRPYSWTLENVEEFWNDTVHADEAEYFIGSMVVYREQPNSDVYFVVDGQQRLTTITIFLAAIRNAIAALGANKRAVAIQKLIEREDIDGKLTYVLKAETSYPYFQEHIQKFSVAALEGQESPEEESLKQAFLGLTGKIEAAVQAVQGDPTVKADKKKPMAIARLTEIRDKLLRLKIIFVELDNEDDAYIIFETLNTRGKDLEAPDLLKNFIIKNVASKNKDVNVAKEKWQEIQEHFVETDADIDLKGFLYHYWLSKHGFVANRRLFKEIKRTIAKSKVPEFLEDLRSAADVYRLIHETDFGDWEKSELPLRASLDALQTFRVRLQVPMVLATIELYRADQISLAMAVEVLRAIEHFHFTFTALTSQRSSGGISSMYSSAARSLWDAKDRNERGRVIRDFVKKLRDRAPDEPEFKIGFNDLKFSSKYTKQRQLVRYVLEGIHRYENPDAGLDYSKMTIEHLASERPKGGQQLSGEMVASLGNLLLVPEDVNSALKNKSFLEKKQILTERGWLKDEYVKKSVQWAEKEIKERTSMLAAIAYQKVWRP